MKTSSPHLADEHMNLYEWSGGVAYFGLPAETRRPHRWHASYGMLAVLTSLLLLNGCDSQEAAPRADDAIRHPVDSMAPNPDTPSETPADDAAQKP